MKYITEQELKNWFKEMKDKYKNSPFSQNLESVENHMFNKFWEIDNLKIHKNT